MRLLLDHPAHANLSCHDCKQWIYDIKTAKPALRGGQRQRRRADQPTPCGECPKKAPGNDMRPKNVRVWELYWVSRSGGLTEEERTDPLVRSNLSMINQIVESWRLSAMLKTKV